VGIVVAVVGFVVLALLAAYATWTAGRLDRLHARIDAAAAALDAQLRRRAATVVAFARGAELPPAVVADLTLAAETAADAAGLGHDREALENSVSRALQAAVQSAPVAFDPSAPGVPELVDDVTRATFARRFHNDAVRDALVVRERRVVRWLHLAGRAPLPAYFEIDDSALYLSGRAVTGSPYD
jgi:hypothetical protein